MALKTLMMKKYVLYSTLSCNRFVFISIILNFVISINLNKTAHCMYFWCVVCVWITLKYRILFFFTSF